MSFPPRYRESLAGLAVLCVLSALSAAPANRVVAAEAGTAPPPAAQPATALDRYLDGLTTLQADFTQTVTDAQGKSAQAGSGSLIVQRPDRFRWDYRPANGAAEAGGGADDEGQLLVADGRSLWFFDRELSQVTVKPIDAALSSTPIMLLSGSAATLREHFEMAAEPTRDGLQWVGVRPRGDQADFSEARLGFHGQELSRMIVHNMLGQTVQLDFSHSRRNAPVAPDTFQFKVPSGVDVIGTPQASPPP